MTEPINKKSGNDFRKTRARKAELEKAVVEKTKTLDFFFKPNVTSNVDEIVNRNCDTRNNLDENENVETESGNIT